MAKMKIGGVHPGVDGEYELDPSFWTSRELHAIKKLTGLRPGEFEEALEVVDSDLIVALAMVSLMRAGKITHGQPWLSDEISALWDAPVGKIQLDLGEEEEAPEADVGPPSQTPTEPESSGTGGESLETSGNGSSEQSVRLARIPPVTGAPPLGTGSTSDPATSAI